MFKNFGNVSGSDSGSTSKSSGGGQDTEAIKKAKAKKGEETEYVYDERDVMLYNLGIGAKAGELPLVFEGADGFQVSDGRSVFTFCANFVSSTGSAHFRCHSPIQRFERHELRLCTQLQPRQAPSRRTILEDPCPYPYFRNSGQPTKAARSP